MTNEEALTKVFPWHPTDKAKQRAYHLARYKKRRLANLERYRAIERRKNKKMYQRHAYLRERLALAQKTPKGRARKILASAVQNGKIKKPKTCRICGMKTLLHGHHFHYSKPLFVVWVCPVCHAQIHRKDHSV